MVTLEVVFVDCSALILAAPNERSRASSGLSACVKSDAVRSGITPTSGPSGRMPSRISVACSAWVMSTLGAAAGADAGAPAAAGRALAADGDGWGQMAPLKVPASGRSGYIAASSAATAAAISFSNGGKAEGLGLAAACPPAAIKAQRVAISAAFASVCRMLGNAARSRLQAHMHPHLDLCLCLPPGPGCMHRSWTTMLTDRALKRRAASASGTWPT